MKMRLSKIEGHSSFLVYAWYLHKTPTSQVPAHTPNSLRITVFARGGATSLNPKAHKATGGHNKLFWRTQVPSRRLFTILACLGFFFMLLRGLAFFFKVYFSKLYLSLAPVVISTIPAFFFACVFAFHLALTCRKLGFGKNVWGVAPSLKKGAALAALGTGVVWSLFQKFSTLRAKKSENPLWRLVEIFYRIYTDTYLHPHFFPALAQFQLGILGSSDRAHVIGTVPSRVFRLTTLGSGFPTTGGGRPLVSSVDFENVAKADRLLGLILKHRALSRVATLSGDVVALAWPSIPTQFLDRTSAVRVATSSWHLFNECALEQSAHLNVTSAQKSKCYVNSLWALPQYDTFPATQVTNPGVFTDISLSTSVKNNVGGSLGLGVDFRHLFLDTSRVFTWLRHPSVAGGAFRLSSVQTSAWSVKTKPWRRI